MKFNANYQHHFLKIIFTKLKIKDQFFVCACNKIISHRDESISCEFILTGCHLFISMTALKILEMLVAIQGLLRVPVAYSFFLARRIAAPHPSYWDFT